MIAKTLVFGNYADENLQIKANQSKSKHINSTNRILNLQISNNYNVYGKGLRMVISYSSGEGMTNFPSNSLELHTKPQSFASFNGGEISYGYNLAIN